MTASDNQLATWSNLEMGRLFFLMPDIVYCALSG